MLSNVFARLLTSARPIRLYQQHLLRSLSTADAAAPEGTTGDREKGTVKRFSKEKGYGFISKNSDGTDCFVHFKNIKVTGFKTLEQGQEVEFSVVQGEKGLEARDVSVLSTGTGRPSFLSEASNNNSTSSRFGFGGTARNQSSSAFSFGDTSSSRSRSSRQSSALDDDASDFGSGSAGSMGGGLFSSRRARPTASDGKRETGSVKRWTEDRGFGFIRRSSGGSDLFCHARSLKDGLRTLAEGQTVQFSVQQTDKGEEARDVSIFTGEIPATEGNESAASTERVTGTVRRWLHEKGYGFLQRDNGEADVFVHARNLPEGTTSLEEGQAVEFTVTSGGKGDVAENITVRAQA